MPTSTSSISRRRRGWRSSFSRTRRPPRRCSPIPRIKGLDTADFRKLVAEYSIDTATKDRGGDLRYFDRNTKELPTPIVTAAFALTNLGDVSPPIKTSQGWNVLKLTGRRKALVRTFDEVKGQIKSRLFRDRRQGGHGRVHPRPARQGPGRGP